jgi:hypothetical protein
VQGTQVPVDVLQIGFLASVVQSELAVHSTHAPAEQIGIPASWLPH